MKKFIVVMLFALSGCQDHHFVPIEKADGKDFPIAVSDPHAPKGAEAPVFDHSNVQPQKQVMTGGYQKEIEPPSGKLIVNGVLELGPEQSKRNFDGFFLYVIAWNFEKPGPPIAVIRQENPKFPQPFSLDDSALMASEFPGSDVKLKIEAWLDGDSDVSTKKKGDVFGFTTSGVKVGEKGVKVILDKDRS